MGGSQGPDQPPTDGDDSDRGGKGGEGGFIEGEEEADTAIVQGTRSLSAVLAQGSMLHPPVSGGDDDDDDDDDDDADICIDECKVTRAADGSFQSPCMECHHPCDPEEGGDPHSQTCKTCIAKNDCMECYHCHMNHHMGGSQGPDQPPTGASS